MRRQTTRGFTLIELLVVIAIISILSGLAVVGINAAIENAKISRTQVMIQALATAIETYESEPTNGLAPPASLDGLGARMGWDRVMDPNLTNAGIETLLVCLRAPKPGGGDPYFPITDYEDLLLNRDDDQAPEAFASLGIVADNVALLELVDPWGNPLVYIPEALYDDGPFDYLDYEQQLVMAQAVATSVSGERPHGYMIWSFGPDGVNNNGKGDDITSWKKSRADEREGTSDDDE